MRFSTFVALILLVLCHFAAAGRGQSPSWRGEFIGAIPAAWNGTPILQDFNDAGQVVGYITIATTIQAWYGDPDQGLQLLPLPAGTDFSQATAINSHGLIGGVIRVGGVFLGCLWQPSPLGYQPMILPAAANGWVPINVVAINDHGDVIGRHGPISRPYYWNQVEGTVPISSTLFPPAAVDINNEREIVGDTLRMDLDTMTVQNLGNPVGVGYSFQFTKLSYINDAGDCAGYGVTGSSSSNFLPVRYSEGSGWSAFSQFPLTSAGVTGISSSGNTVFQLGIFGSYIHVDGVGSLGLSTIVDPLGSDVNVTGVGALISRGDRLIGTGVEISTGLAGLVLLSPATFEDLGGATSGSLGTPILGGFGDLTPGSPTRIRLSSAAKNSVAYVLYSASSNPIPLLGGLLSPYPFLGYVPVSIDSQGRFDLTVPWPVSPVGQTIYLQALIEDPSAASGVALSNAIAGTTK